MQSEVQGWKPRLQVVQAYAVVQASGVRPGVQKAAVLDCESIRILHLVAAVEYRISVSQQHISEGAVRGGRNNIPHTFFPWARSLSLRFVLFRPKNSMLLSRTCLLDLLIDSMKGIAQYNCRRRE